MVLSKISLSLSQVNKTNISVYICILTIIAEGTAARGLVVESTRARRDLWWHMGFISLERALRYLNYYDKQTFLIDTKMSKFTISNVYPTGQGLNSSCSELDKDLNKYIRTPLPRSSSSISDKLSSFWTYVIIASYAVRNSSGSYGRRKASPVVEQRSLYMRFHKKMGLYFPSFNLMNKTTPLFLEYS